MLELSELVSQLLEEVLLPAEVLGHHTEDIDVPIITVSLKPKTAKDLQPVAYLLKVKDLVVGRLCHFTHPLIDDFP